MSPAVVVQALSERGIALSKTAAGLRVRDPLRNLTIAEATDLRAHREELLAYLETQLPTCAVCGAKMDSDRVYACSSCQEQRRPLLVSSTPCLCGQALLVSHQAPPAYRWWEDGQAAQLTALELGAPADVVNRLVPIYSSKEGKTQDEIF